MFTDFLFWKLLEDSIDKTLAMFKCLVKLTSAASDGVVSD